MFGRAMGKVTEKQCRGCKTVKARSRFRTTPSGRPGWYCDECEPRLLRGKKARNRAWAEANPEHRAAYTRRYNQRLRLEVLTHYGLQCACCGESNLGFLTIEHKEGVPDSHRSASGKRRSGAALWLQIKREGFPDHLETLCWNCNMGRALYGRCPHEESLRQHSE